MPACGQLNDEVADCTAGGNELTFIPEYRRNELASASPTPSAACMQVHHLLVSSAEYPILDFPDGSRPDVDFDVALQHAKDLMTAKPLSPGTCQALAEL